MKRFWILKALLIIPIVAAFAVLFAGVVMLLWNALMPDIFGLPIITFWQAAGLLILSKILSASLKNGVAVSRIFWKIVMVFVISMLI